MNPQLSAALASVRNAAELVHSLPGPRARAAAVQLESAADRIDQLAARLWAGPTANRVKRQVIGRALRRRPYKDWSLKRLGRHFGVSHTLVRAVRLELEQTGTIDPAGKGASRYYGPATRRGRRPAR